MTSFPDHGPFRYRRPPLHAILLAGIVLSAATACGSAVPRAEPTSVNDPAVTRFATFNTSLHHEAAGGLLSRLQEDDPSARRIAAIIQHTRPDVLLLNEFDHDADGAALELFQSRYLAQGQFGEQPIAYRYHFVAPVNTGVDSGFDLDGDGRIGGPGDAWGYGTHPGQYGMVVLSRHPIANSDVRSFRDFRWADLPGALRPWHPEQAEPWYDDDVWSKLPLSSKSHWDVPIETPLGRVHLLAAHPTPPVFDGPEDRNGARNHDEIRFWAEYVSDPEAQWIVDDQGRRGGLPAGAAFVVAGDYNADPLDGDSRSGAMQQLLAHPRLLVHPAPVSKGAVERATELVGEVPDRRGDPARHTGDFGAPSGNLRVDYVLPSVDLGYLGYLDGGVFWPRRGEPGYDWVGASDHRLVWVDLQRQAAVRQRD
jgi:endonuclease/exonuclease/phosphatase family metal-dependent hydrolase